MKASICSGLRRRSLVRSARCGQGWRRSRQCVPTTAPAAAASPNRRRWPVRAVPRRRRAAGSAIGGSCGSSFVQRRVRSARRYTILASGVAQRPVIGRRTAPSPEPLHCRDTAPTHRWTTSPPCAASSRPRAGSRWSACRTSGTGRATSSPSTCSSTATAIFPVNPRLAGTTLLGETVVASVLELDEPVDMVDVFRRSRGRAADRAKRR